MDGQFIITIGREYGSGGKIIAEAIAKHYNIPIYEKNLLEEIAMKKHLDASGLYEYDESKKTPFFSRTVRGMSNSHTDNIAQLQFDFLKEKAEAGESFVVVGRASEYVLREFDCRISFFITADKDVKIERIMKMFDKSQIAAEDFCNLMDTNRKRFHNSYSNIKWGDSRGYDMCINSAKLDLYGTTMALIRYIDDRRKKLNEK